jgi:hypothetical protein
MYSVTEWLLGAAAGDQLLPAAGAVTSLLASAAAGNEPAVDGLDCGQVVRAMLHAAAAAKHAEVWHAVSLAVQQFPCCKPACLELNCCTFGFRVACFMN